MSNLALMEYKGCRVFVHDKSGKFTTLDMIVKYDTLDDLKLAIDKRSVVTVEVAEKLKNLFFNYYTNDISSDEFRFYVDKLKGENNEHCG